MDFATFSKRIADAFPILGPRLRHAARYAIDRLDDVALMSLRRLASSAGVHPSDTVRLVRSFGFDSYQLFQKTFAITPQDLIEAAVKGQAGVERKFVVDLRGGYPDAILLENRSGAFAYDLRNFGECECRLEKFQAYWSHRPEKLQTHPAR